MIAAGTFSAPASPGTVEVNVSGGFEVGAVLILTCNKDTTGWRQESGDITVVYDLSLGMAGLEGTFINNFCLNWAYRYVAGTESGISFFDDSCIRTRDDTGTTNPVTAAVTSFDADGFTVDYSETVSGRDAWYLAWPLDDEEVDIGGLIVAEFIDDASYDLGSAGRAGLILRRGSAVVPGTWFQNDLLGSIGFISQGHDPFAEGQNEYGGIAEGRRSLQTRRSWRARTNSGSNVIEIYMDGPLGTVLDGFAQAEATATGFDLADVQGVGEPDGYGSAFLIGDDEQDRSWYQGINPPLSGTRFYSMAPDQKESLEGQAAVVLGGNPDPENTTGSWRISLGFAHPDLQVCIALSKDHVDGSITQGVVDDSSWIAYWDHDNGSGDNFRGSMAFPEAGIISATAVSSGSGTLASPSVFAAGNLAGVSSGEPLVPMPLHQINDILVMGVTYWGPNTAGDAAQIPTPDGWAVLAPQVGQPASPDRDGWMAWFWKRATSSYEPSVSLARGAGWDDGADTGYNGRAWSIRGAEETGNPYEDVQTAGPYTTADQPFPALTVSGSQRLAVQFCIGRVVPSAAAGWTAGTTDSGLFSAMRQFNKVTSVSTGADATTTSAPPEFAYSFCGVVFLPENVSGQLIAPWVTGPGTVRHEVPFLYAGYA